MSRFCLRPRVRADIPGASRPKIETHQRPLDAKNKLAGNRPGSDFRGTPSFFLGKSDRPRRVKGRQSPEPVQSASQRAVEPALEDGLCRRLVALHGGSSLSVPQPLLGLRGLRRERMKPPDGGSAEILRMSVAWKSVPAMTARTGSHVRRSTGIFKPTERY